MSESIEVSRIVPASAEAIYKAWLSGPEHGRMTGSTATYNEDDDTFTAWEGYISGKTLEKEPYSRIVQAWRTTEFLETDPDSTLEILLDPQGNGTMVTVRQSNIPVGQGDSYRSGWDEHYFEPMIAYSQSARAKLAEAGHAVSEAASEAAEAVSEAAGKAGDALEAASEQVQKSANKAARSVQKSAGKAGDALEAAGDQVQKTANKAARSVQKTAKKAASAVKKFVATAKKKIAARKAKAKPAAKKAMKKLKAAPKKAKKAVAKKTKPAARKKAAGKKKKRG